MMNRIFLLLGSNEGNRFQLMEQAQQMIKSTAGEIMNESHMYETAAWGNEKQHPFLNKVLEIQTTKDKKELLQFIAETEKQLGRVRKEKWGARRIDIDILFFNNEIIHEPDLTIPHHQMHLRRFTLEPLAEIAGDFTHPVFHKTINELLKECADPLPVKMLNNAV